MKALCYLFLISTLMFSMDIKHEMLKCSEIKVNDSRLMCFDVISQMLKPTPKERVRAQFLIKECATCHGARWDIPTIQDSRAVRHMSQTQIHEALRLYQQKKRGSSIMQDQVNQMSDEDIELISKYIVNFVSEEIN